MTLTESPNPRRRIRHQTETPKLHKTQNPLSHSQQTPTPMDLRKTRRKQHQTSDISGQPPNRAPHKTTTHPKTWTKHKILPRPTKNTPRNCRTHKKSRETHRTRRTLPGFKRRHIRRHKLQRNATEPQRRKSHSHNSPPQS